MTQISFSGFEVQPLRGSSRSLRVYGFAGAAVFLLLAMPCLQAQSDSNSNAATKGKPAITASPAASQGLASRPAAPSAPRQAIEEPTRAPLIAWDGKQLTIDAENSTLADILEAVRAQTGASIEMPSTASVERVFVHVGPGPPRDVLSSLVYGMRFDYVIETADDDPDTLRRVVLTAQGAGDSDVVVAGTPGTGDAGGPPLHRGTGDGRARSGVRMMPGWAGPGMPSFQIDAEAALAAKEAAAQDASETQDSTSTKDPSATQDTAEVKDSAATQNTAESKESPATAVTPGAADPADVTRAANSSPSNSESNEQSGVGQAIQNMTQMFEQRRQLQSQQNQHQAQPPQ